jgi:hypothetical protein
MKTYIDIVRMHGPGLAGTALAAGILATSCASAELHTHARSTTMMQTDAPQGFLETRVVRHPDGQTVITRDGNNVDITTQRSGAGPSAVTPGDLSTRHHGRFDRSWTDHRFGATGTRRDSASDDIGSDRDSVRAAFSQRMLDRMHGFDESR